MIKDDLKLIDWLVKKQNMGFHGRTNKDDDSCYSFWIGSSLKIVGFDNLINIKFNLQFLKDCQNNVIGGFAKHIGGNPDPLHSCLSLASISYLNKDLNETSPLVNLPVEKLKKWNQNKNKFLH